MARKSGSLLSVVLIAATLLILVTGLVKQRQVIGHLEARTNHFASYAEKAFFADRVAGLRLPEQPVVRLADQSTVALKSIASGKILWYVTPQTCVACFDNLPALRASIGSQTDQIVLVLGKISVDDASMLASKRSFPAEVFVDETGAIHEALQMQMPSVYLAVDGDGVIRIAEARSTETSCSWDFVAGVLAMSDLQIGEGAVTP